ncbi:hypothetical protein BDR22DRAFT_830700, partial [Usnea florida]
MHKLLFFLFFLGFSFFLSFFSYLVSERHFTSSSHHHPSHPRALTTGSPLLLSPYPLNMPQYPTSHIPDNMLPTSAKLTRRISKNLAKLSFSLGYSRYVAYVFLFFSSLFFPILSYPFLFLFFYQRGERRGYRFVENGNGAFVCFAL